MEQELNILLQFISELRLENQELDRLLNKIYTYEVNISAVVHAKMYQEASMLRDETRKAKEEVRLLLENNCRGKLNLGKLDEVWKIIAYTIREI